MKSDNKAVYMAAVMAAVLLLGVVYHRYIRGSRERLSDNSDPAPPSGEVVFDDRAVDGRRPTEENIVELLAKFQDASKEDLPLLLREFRELKPEARTRLVERFFASGTDASIDDGFRVGANGFLTDSPTLRVWLLDHWARLDPELAAKFSRELLDSSTSADEWAVALRTLAKGDSSPDGREALAAKAQELLSNSEWAAQPSSGFLQAFDVPVFLEDTEFVPSLTRLLRNTNQTATAYAAFLTLDRLTMAAPDKFLAEFVQAPEAFAGREEVRAGYFARADLSQPAQRRLVENYLLEGKLSAAELETFAGLFPNASRAISHNLLTQSRPVDGRELAAKDAKALTVIREWRTDARFASVGPVLAAIEQRLAEFVRQAGSVRN